MVAGGPSCNVALMHRTSRQRDGGGMSDESLDLVKLLFDQVGLTMTDEEYERFGRTYGWVRAQADGLYSADLDQEVPAVAFDPLRPYE